MIDIPTVITFTPEGNAQFTRGDSAAHAILDDMFEIGDMLRVTDICMHKETKRYMVKWLKGPYANDVHKIYMHCSIFGFGITSSTAILIENETLLFDTYERAVEYERMCLVALRKKGIVF
jgi:hypothetical protein